MSLNGDVELILIVFVCECVNSGLKLTESGSRGDKGGLLVDLSGLIRSRLRIGVTYAELDERLVKRGGVTDRGVAYD